MVVETDDAVPVAPPGTAMVRADAAVLDSAVVSPVPAPAGKVNIKVITAAAKNTAPEDPARLRIEPGC